ncbi:MAG: TRAP transporter small permease [Sneathiellales bacterium]|nr:TRAP transporter small permease [Sneathiellales bacterium]
MTVSSFGWARVHTLVHRLCKFWALLGGLVLIAVVLINAFSITSDMIANKPFPGDFELTEVGVAIAAFCFLPFCQITGSNVSADLFTAGASQWQIAAMRFFANSVALVFASLLLWRMWDGLLDYREYEEVTGILSFPLWIGFVPCLMSLVLLVAASFMSLVDFYGTRQRA